jgi:hypothetical protein
MLAISVIAAGQTAPAGSGKSVEIAGFDITGTRIPAGSVIALSGLKAHDSVTEKGVDAACRRITATGLFKSIDYSYAVYPDRPGAVLGLKVVDEGPLVPASIKPAAQEAVIWAALEAMDPVFTRQLPPTEKAIAFYERNIEKCVQASGRKDEYAAGTVTADARGNPSGVTFEIHRYKSLSPAK